MARNHLRVLFVAAGILALGGCSTPYQDMGLLGGVSATPIDANTLRISSRGNRFSDLGQMKDYVLLRAAEETLTHGFDIFEIVESENATRIVSVPVSHTSMTPTVTFGMDPVHPNDLTTPTFGVSPTTTYSTESFTKPGQDIIVKMFKGPKPDGSDMYSAAEVVAFLGPHVRGGDDAVFPTLPLLTGTAPANVPTQPAGDSADVPPAPIPVCTAQDRQMAKMAEQNGWQYAKSCR
jgi:hypothetical protein